MKHRVALTVASLLSLLFMTFQAKDGFERALVGPMPPDSLLEMARRAN
jgi:hypothetical protein